MTIHQGFNTYTIHSADQSTQATFVPELGGCASSIIMPGKTGPRELLFLHDFFFTKNWPDLAGGWPFCFPVCGRLIHQGKIGCYVYQDKEYHLPIHGFAWQKPWDVAAIEKHMIEMVLTDDAHTRSVYPFTFEIRLRYTLAKAKLTCEQTYCNHSDKSMPFYAGFHPYFLTPSGSGKEKVMLEFQPQKRFIYNDTLTDIIGEQPIFKTPVAVTDPNINEQFTWMGEHQQIQLSYPNGDRLRMFTPFPYLQLYTIPDYPFICAEPWMARPNAMNHANGVRWLKPGGIDKSTLRVELE